jgi:tetratricopeptide (TPR) repeat protein
LRVIKNQKFVHLANFILMVNKLLVFLIIVLSANGFLYAQNSVVYQNIINEEGTIKYSLQVENDQQEKNFIIQQLALSIPKKAEFTEYSYTFSVILRVQKAGDFKFNATVETDNYKCFGDIHYKGFDISDVLIPSKLDLILSVFSGNLPKLDNKHIANAPMKFGYNKIFTAQFIDSTVIPAFSINISNKKVIYDTVSTGSFVRKRKLIDDYYLSELQMADATKLLEKIDYKDVDMAIVYDIRLMDVEKIVNQLFQKDFPARLFLANYDPINYIDKFNKLSTETIKARNELNKNLSILDKLLYEKGLDFLKKNDIKNAVLYFNKTIDYNKYYAPAHYQLARMLYRKDSIYHSSEIIMDIFTNMNPDPETYKNLILLSDSLMKSFMVNGAYYLKTEKYNEAVECYETLIKFCSSTSGLKCADESYKSLSLARFGIFKSYLDVSKRAIDGNRLNLAEVYVLEAKAFQKKYSRDIINDEEADVMMARLAKAYITLGDSSLNRKKYEKALDYYGKAISLCDSNDNIKCPEDINYKISRSKNGLFEEMVKLAYIQYKNKNINRAEVIMAEADDFKKTNPKDITRNAGYDSVMYKIKYLRYHEIVKESRYLSVFASYNEMIERMKLAKELEKTFRIPSSRLMDSLIDIYAKPFIQKSIKNIYPLVNAGKTDSAKVLAAIQENNIKELLLAGDTSLTNKITDVKYYIIHVECTSSMSYFNEAFQRAIELANTNDFIYSVVYADSALSIAKKHIDCAIDTSDIFSLKERHKKPVVYQKLLVLANNNYFRSKFDSSLYYYLKAEKYFNTERIVNSGLKHISVENFILNKNNEKFIFFGINYLADSIYCDKSLFLLKEMEKKSFQNLLLKDEQQKLGRNTAIQDKKVQPANKARQNFKTRIGKDKWFKYYKNAYYKAWYNNRFYYVFFMIF